MASFTKMEREVVEDAVSFFKLVWDEVDKQFAAMKFEDRLKVYDAILPVITDTLLPADDRDDLWPLIEEIEENMKKLDSTRERKGGKSGHR
ncbi:MAG: hypothetical protein ACUVT7_05400 [Thermoplasmata archaeon]